MALSMANELGALAVLAEHDPDSGVRAIACQALARAAAPNDDATYAVLSRVAEDDPNGEVRASIVANIRGDAPESVRCALKQWMRDGSVDVERAAVEAAFATSENPTAFLHRMRAEPVRRLQYALRLLRGKCVAVEWCDVGERIEHRAFSVLLELALLFASRPEAPPLSFWLRCAVHMQDLVAETEAIRDLVVRAMVDAFSAATPDTALAVDDSELLHRALTVLAELLPTVSHTSYLELKAAGAIPHAAASPLGPVESGFARLWLALSRLSPTPGQYILAPSYK